MADMDKHELQKLRDLPIEGVAERLGIRVSRGRFLCPAHADHTPSASISRTRNAWRCWSCGAGGNAIDLAMHVLHQGFREACEWLANEHNIIINNDHEPDRTSVGKVPTFDASRYERFFLRPWLSDEARRFLFQERRLDPRVIHWCRITSWRDRQGVAWLQTPYYDVDGRLIGVQNRNLHKGASPRFKFPYGSRCSIYNLPVLRMLRPGEELWITEGCSDCWAMLSAGHKAIAIPSATLLSHKDKELLSSLSSSLSLRWNMYPDNDAPGERLFLQLKEILPDLQHHHLPPGCKDFSDYYVQQKSNSNE